MAKKISTIAGIVFALIGILGFFPNGIVGIGGFFEANTAHNIVHLLSAVVFFIAASKDERVASMTLTIFGVVYLLVALLGIVQSDQGMANILGIIQTNTADTYLHIVLGLAFLGTGLATKNEASAVM